MLCELQQTQQHSGSTGGAQKRAEGEVLVLVAKRQRIATAGTVDQVARYFQRARIFLTLDT